MQELNFQELNDAELDQVVGGKKAKKPKVKRSLTIKQKSNLGVDYTIGILSSDKRSFWYENEVEENKPS